MADQGNLSRLLILPSGDWDSARIIEYLGFSANDPHVLLVTVLEDEKNIKIEQIRNLQTLLVTAQKGRVVLIYPAEKIIWQAQLALLKLVEEPPQGTSIVLAAFSRTAVAPTIVSRCVVEIITPEGQSSKEASLFSRLLKATTIKQGVEIAQSLPGKRDELIAYLTQELRLARQEKPTKESVELQEKTLEVLEALRVNVSPALCAEAICLERWRR